MLQPYYTLGSFNTNFITFPEMLKFSKKYFSSNNQKKKSLKGKVVNLPEHLIF
jgi:hypothetical protein